MKFIEQSLDGVRDFVKGYMHSLASDIHKLSSGRVSPNSVTIVGLLAHIPIAILIALGSFYWAACLLVIFGLFDSLDGALARLQNKASDQGMLLDASTDRMKEVLLYSGAAYYIAGVNPQMAFWAVLACGASITVSYVKAKGETAIAGKKLSANKVNRMFQSGLFRFEVRMTLLVIGLVINQIIAIVVIIAIASAYTAIERLILISKQLK